MVSDVYIYAEPDPETREVFIDQNGKPHLDRDEAIKANVRDDLEKELRVQLTRAFPDQHEEREWMARALAHAIATRRNPLREVIRQMIESTD